MFRGLRRHSPALPIACVALFVALGGSVYATSKIDGRSIRAASLPGDRLVPRSVPGNRLRPSDLPGNRLVPGSITGTEVDATSLGEVPSAVRADSARSAATALSAESAKNAERLNGYRAGCGGDTRAFAGACWQIDHSKAALAAPAAAVTCAAQGGELPGALALAAFSQQAGITLAVGDEWSGDIAVASGPGLYSVATVSSAAIVDFALSTDTRKFRCVLPLVG
jgi:hypothetical protein